MFKKWTNVTISVVEILNYTVQEKYVSFIGFESTETYMIKSNHIISHTFLQFNLSN